MKLACYILSALLIFLSVLPCADVEIHTVQDSSLLACNSSNQLADTHQHEHSGEEDSCSPLCACQCCHISCTVFPELSLVEEIETSEYTKKYKPLYHNSLLGQFTTDHFRPPQV